MPDSSEYWNQRYVDGNIPWDLGYPSPALMDYVIQNTEQSARILIPGGGHSPELAALWDLNYQNVYTCDWSESALEFAQKQNPTIPSDRFILGNFFELEGSYDLILEQTFFCAIPPAMRIAYAAACARLLKARSGRLAGVFFHREFEEAGPPFGGFEEDYLEILGSHLTLIRSEMNKKAIKPRQGTELFMEWKSN